MTRCPACGTGGHARARHVRADEVAPPRVATAPEGEAVDLPREELPAFALGALLGLVVGLLAVAWVLA